MGRYTAEERAGFKRNQPEAKKARRDAAAAQSTNSAATQAAALRGGEPSGSITNSTPVNPAQQTAFDATTYGTDRAAAFESDIANQTARETTGVIAQQRDEGDIGAKRVEEAAAAVGAGRVGAGSYAAMRAREQGKRDLQRTRFDAMRANLGAHNDALRTLSGADATEAGAAGSLASEQRMLNLGTLSAQNDVARTDTDRAATEARLEDDAYDRLMRMMESTASASSAFDFGSSSSSGLGDFSHTGFAAMPALNPGERYNPRGGGFG